MVNVSIIPDKVSSLTFIPNKGEAFQIVCDFCDIESNIKTILDKTKLKEDRGQKVLISFHINPVESFY